MRAVSEYSEEKQISVAIGSDLFDSIFNWFRDRSRPGAHAAGSMLVGAYYYQGCFWPVSIPIAYGQVPIDAFEALRPDMADSLIHTIQASRPTLEHYLLTWADCIDWAFGHSDLHGGTSTCSQFVRAANDDLHGASTTLTGNQSRNAAYQQSRMTAEKSLKAFLAERDGLSEDQLRNKFGHNLVKLATSAQRHAAKPELSAAAPGLATVEEVGDRYSGRAIPHAELWEIYCLCLGVAAAVMRELSGRDARQQVLDRLAKS